MRVASVNLGKAATVAIAGRPTLTAIGKHAVTGPVAVRPLGLEGDEQADLSVHGGLAKAVYAYPGEHYPFWRTVRAQAGVALWDEVPSPGSLGENLTLKGLLESQVWVGDRLRLPNCTLAVSEPRQPCFKFNAAMGFAQAAKMMVQSGWCGFYLAVVEPGTVEAGQPFEIDPGARELRIDEWFRATASRRSA